MKINKEILVLALPNIISNISVPLISTVDTALMGRMSELHLGAIGLGAMIFNFLYWNFGFLRMGTTGVTAQAYGADDGPLISSHLGKALLVALGIGLLMILFREPLFYLAEMLLFIGPDHVDYVHHYYDVRIMAAPASLALFALLGWLFGMQNAIYPLIITIVINITNIVLSYYFVVQLEWGIQGVATGTVIAQYIGVITAAGLIAYRYMSILNEFQAKMITQLSDYRQFFSINGDIFIRTLFLSSAFAFFYAQSSQESEIILAVNVVLLQFLHWMSYIIDGFAYASEALVGKYKGRQSSEMMSRTINYSMLWGLGMALVFSGIYAIWGEEILRIFTDEQVVINAAKPMIKWMILLPIFGFASYIWDGVYIGLTASKSMRNSMIISFAGYLLLWWLIRDIYPAQSLWIALISFLFFRGVVQTILYRVYGSALR